MDIDDIRAFIPSKNYEISQAFYQALGFKMEYVTDDLSLFENGKCTFFLQRFYNQNLAQHFMLQMSVPNIDVAYELVTKMEGFKISYQPIVTEHWGKIFYLWGPSGELLHITEFTLNK